MCGTRNAASTRPATQGRLGQVHRMPCSNSVISGVGEAEKYLLPLTLHQSLMVFPGRISLLSRSYYIMKLGLDSNQHTHHARCVRPSVIYQSTTWYSAEPSATQAQWASNPHLLCFSERHHCRQSPSHGVLESNQQGVVDFLYSATLFHFRSLVI